MGIELDLVLLKEGEEVNKHLLCGICFMILEEPVQCVINLLTFVTNILQSSCQACFCKECIEIWKQRKHQCPNRCDGYLKTENVHRIIRNMVEDLTIMCKYNQEGCDKLFKVGELKHHSEICPYHPLSCQNSGCDYVAARHLMKDHHPQCEYKTEICQKGCQKVLKLSEIPNHNCIASLTAEVKMLRANEELLREDVVKQQELIKELSGSLQLKNYVHENISCYECMMDPIKTDRFKCQQCQDYDICLYCYCRGSHPKTHKFTVLGPLGVVIVKESDVAYFQKRGQILKKEIFFKNMGEELELTVRPYNNAVFANEMQQQPVHLSEFQSTYIQVPQGECGSVYFHFIVQNDDGNYSARFRFYCRKRNEYFGNNIIINYQVSGVSIQQ